MDEKKNEVIKILNELITIFKGRNTVRKILQAKDVKAVYESEKAAMRDQLESFDHEMWDFIKEGEQPIYDASEVISVDNVVEICFILLMSGVDDDDLIDDWESIGEILEYVPEDLQEIAERLLEFLCEEACCFADYSEEELLKKLLL